MVQYSWRAVVLICFALIFSTPLDMAWAQTYEEFARCVEANAERLQALQSQQYFADAEFYQARRNYRSAQANLRTVLNKHRTVEASFQNLEAVLTAKIRSAQIQNDRFRRRAAWFFVETELQRSVVLSDGRRVDVYRALSGDSVFRNEENKRLAEIDYLTQLDTRRIESREARNIINRDLDAARQLASDGLKEFDVARERHFAMRRAFENFVRVDCNTGGSSAGDPMADIDLDDLEESVSRDRSSPDPELMPGLEGATGTTGLNFDDLWDKVLVGDDKPEIDLDAPWVDIDGPVDGEEVSAIGPGVEPIPGLNGDEPSSPGIDLSDIWDGLTIDGQDSEADEGVSVPRPLTLDEIEDLLNASTSQHDEPQPAEAADTGLVALPDAAEPSVSPMADLPGELNAPAAELAGMDAMLDALDPDAADAMRTLLELDAAGTDVSALLAPPVEMCRFNSVLICSAVQAEDFAACHAAIVSSNAQCRSILDRQSGVQSVALCQATCDVRAEEASAGLMVRDLALAAISRNYSGQNELLELETKLEWVRGLRAELEATVEARIIQIYVNGETGAVVQHDGPYFEPTPPLLHSGSMRANPSPQQVAALLEIRKRELAIETELSELNERLAGASVSDWQEQAREFWTGSVGQGADACPSGVEVANARSQCRDYCAGQGEPHGDFPGPVPTDVCRQSTSPLMLASQPSTERWLVAPSN